MVKNGYVAAVRLDVDSTVLPCYLFALEQGQDASAIEFKALRFRHTACFEDCGKHVDMGCDSVGRCARFYDRRPLEEER